MQQHPPILVKRERLTPDEARARLRAAASKIELGAMVKHRPWTSVSVALAAGLIVGMVPTLRKSLTAAAVDLLGIRF